MDRKKSLTQPAVNNVYMRKMTTRLVDVCTSANAKVVDENASWQKTENMTSISVAAMVSVTGGRNWGMPSVKARGEKASISTIVDRQMKTRCNDKNPPRKNDVVVSIGVRKFDSPMMKPRTMKRLCLY